MPIHVQCSGCGKTIRAAEKLAGQLAPCPGCNTPIAIPAQKSEQGEVQAGHITPPPLPPPITESILRRTANLSFSKIAISCGLAVAAVAIGLFFSPSEADKRESRLQRYYTSEQTLDELRKSYAESWEGWEAARDEVLNAFYSEQLGIPADEATKDEKEQAKKLFGGLEGELYKQLKQRLKADPRVKRHDALQEQVKQAESEYSEAIADLKLNNPAELEQRYLSAIEILDEEDSRLLAAKRDMDDSQQSIEATFYFGKLGFYPEKAKAAYEQSKRRMRELYTTYKYETINDTFGLGRDSRVMELLRILSGEFNEESSGTEPIAVKELPESLRKEVEFHEEVANMVSKWYLFQLGMGFDDESPLHKELSSLKEKDPLVQTYEEQLARAHRAQQTVDVLHKHLK